MYKEVKFEHVNDIKTYYKLVEITDSINNFLKIIKHVLLELYVTTTRLFLK